MRLIRHVVIWISLWLLAMVRPGVARDYRVASLAWLTFQGKLIDNEDILSSFMILPIAVRHFNQRNGTFVPAVGQLRRCTARLRLVGGIQDTAGSPNIAMDQFLESYNQYKLDFVQGPARSDVALSVGVTAGALDIPLISHTSFAESLSDKSVYPSLFRVVPSDGQFAESLAQLFEQFNYRTVSVINSDDTFGRDFSNALFSSCQTRKIKVRSYFYDINQASEEILFRSIRRSLGLIAQERISVIFYMATSNLVLRSIVKAAKELNWIENKLYIGQRNSLLEAFEGIDPNEEIYADIRKFLLGSLNLIRAYNLSNPNWVRLRDAWSTFSAEEVNPYLPNGTTSAGESFKLPSDYFQREKFLFPKHWFFARAYDSIMAMGIAACGPSTLSLMDNLRRVSFMGTTGQIKFDASQNLDSSTVIYAMENVINDSSSPIGLFSNPVGTYYNFNWTFEAPIVFNDGTSQPPLDIAPPTHVIDQLPFGAKVFGWVESAIGMTLSLWAMFYVIAARKSKVFVNAQPVFMVLLIFGSALMAASIVPLTIESDAGCMLFPWLFTTGFTLTLTSLIAKSARVAILWYGHGTAAERSQLVRAKVLLSGVLLVMFIQLMIMTAWQVVAPLQFALITSKTDADGYPLESSVTCVLSSDTSIVFLAIMATFLGAIVVITVCVSLWVRNAPEKFHEAKMTAVAGLVLFQMFFVGIPTAAVVWGIALARFLVLSSIMFMLCITVLVTLFFPKVYKWRFKAWNLIPLSSQPNETDGNDSREGRERKVESHYTVVEGIDLEKRSRVVTSRSQRVTTAISRQQSDGVETFREDQKSSKSSQDEGIFVRRGKSSDRMDWPRYSEPKRSSVAQAQVEADGDSSYCNGGEEEKQCENSVTLEPGSRSDKNTSGNLLSTLSSQKLPPAFFFESQQLQPPPQPAPEGQQPLLQPYPFNFFSEEDDDENVFRRRHAHDITFV